MEKKFLDKQGLAEVSKHFDDKYASKDDVPTKLAELEEDETHKVVTQEEKDTWNKKLDENSNISQNQVTFNVKGVVFNSELKSHIVQDFGDVTDTLEQALNFQSEDIAKLMRAKQNAEFVATLDNNKKIPIHQIPEEALKNTSSATFVIANYDSSENSKAGADYVIQENESPCEVINSFIEKLPEYGGKIQLTEGNFVETKPTLIVIPEERSYVTIAGYGHSTFLKRAKDAEHWGMIQVIGKRNQIRDLRIDDTGQATLYIDSAGSYCIVDNCFVLSRGGVGVTVSADNCVVSNCVVGSLNSVAILIGASQVKVSNCHAETLLDDDMGCIQFHFAAKNCVVSNCSVSAKKAYGIEVLGDYNSVSDCYAYSETNSAFSLSGNYSTASNCTGDSKDNFTFAVTGVGNKFIGCSAHATGENRGAAFSAGSKSRHCSIENCVGISDHLYAFGIAGQNHTVTNCVAESKANNGFILGGSGHTLSNCSSIGGVDTGIYSMAEGAIFSNCVITNKEGVSVSAIELSSKAKNNWCVGTKIYGGAVANKGTGNTVERTIKIPAPLKE